MSKQNAILLPGGAGYIGSHIVVELLEKTDFIVLVLDNLSNAVGNPKDLNLLPPSLERCLKIVKTDSTRLKFYFKEYNDSNILTQLNDEFNIITTIIVAGYKAVGESRKLPLKYYQNNVCKTVNMLTTLNKLNLKNVIFSSSATVYNTMPDDNIIALDESLPVGKCSCSYARTKYFIEEILRDLCDADKEWRAITLRYFNPVGAHPSGLIGEDPQGIPNNLMPMIAQVAVGRRPQLTVFGNDYKTIDGTGVRDYLHIVDLANAHVKAINFLPKIGNLNASGDTDKYPGFVAINLGSGTGNSVLQVIEAFEKSCQKTLPWKYGPRRLGDVTDLHCNPDFAAKVLNWKTEKSLQDMCNDTWNFQKNNPFGYGGEN